MSVSDYTVGEAAREIRRGLDSIGHGLQAMGTGLQAIAEAIKEHGQLEIEK